MASFEAYAYVGQAFTEQKCVYCKEEARARACFAAAVVLVDRIGKAGSGPGRCLNKYFLLFVTPPVMAASCTLCGSVEQVFIYLSFM